MRYLFYLCIKCTLNMHEILCNRYRQRNTNCYSRDICGNIRHCSLTRVILHNKIQGHKWLCFYLKYICHSLLKLSTAEAGCHRGEIFLPPKPGFAPCILMFNLIQLSVLSRGKPVKDHDLLTDLTTLCFSLLPQ